MSNVTYESLFGERVELVGQHANGPAEDDGQGVLAFSTAPYLPDVEREGRCNANDFTCKAYKVKGKDYCQGHLRSLNGDAG